MYSKNRLGVREERWHSLEQAHIVGLSPLFDVGIIVDGFGMYSSRPTVVN